MIFDWMETVKDVLIFKNEHHFVRTTFNDELESIIHFIITIFLHVFYVLLLILKLLIQIS